MSQINDFCIQFATVNGSGSQSANQILAKALFRCGLEVGAKNLFPSNIQGLPTWFIIRVNEKAYTTPRLPFDLVLAMNVATAAQDIKNVKPGGHFLYNSDLKVSLPERDDIQIIGISFKKIVKGLTDSIKLKKYLTNMVYVGVIAEALKIPQEVIKSCVEDQFRSKPNVVDVNLKAVTAGMEYVRSENISLPLQVQKQTPKKQDQLFIDGNTSAALGALQGGAHFMSWYPITPSSSLAEAFIQHGNKSRLSQEGQKQFSVVQAEDELSAISMVLGAGWAGARAMTATSGPGLSLMAEAAGLSYFAEIPAVIWDVQRVGPSTGLPTRTMQGDVLSAAKLSHGDTHQILLFPATPKECFEFGQTAFDLAEQLQSLVIVLTDLDLGMNTWASDNFDLKERKLERGKVLKVEDLDRLGEFSRYKDLDDDGITYRTLPGTAHLDAAYFTRGTGHDEKANYSEDNKNYEASLDRLVKKFNTAKNIVPAPILTGDKNAKIGILAYGSTDQAIPEIRDELKAKGHATKYLRLRAYPFSDEVEEFISSCEKVFVIEQNRDGQLLSLLKEEWPEHWQKYHSLKQYDGWPISAQKINTYLSQESRWKN